MPMSSIVGLLHRHWQLRYPPAATKSEHPLRFGILGAADIGPQAIIVPAKSHPDVVIQAVAARNEEKATAYAKRYGIPEVKTSYQALLDDPKIDCVYIPLPNGLHFEWSLKALKAGKHVLVEKPSFNNTSEAEAIWNHPVLSPSAGLTPPVLLEAVHYLFHPAWAKFMSLVSSKDVVKAKAVLYAPSILFKDDNIRFRYELAGGALMDLGSYTASALVRVFGAVAETCEEAVVKPGTYDARCDQTFDVKYRFPGGGFGEMVGDLQLPLWQTVLPWITVEHRPTVLSATEVGRSLQDGQEIVRTRSLKFMNFVIPTFWHYIQVEDEYTVRVIGDEKNVVDTWKESKTIKTYTWREAGIEQDGEPFWITYRYQLEQFVNRVRGKETPQWVDGGRSTDTLQMLDMAYHAAGLPLRPTSEYR